MLVRVAPVITRVFAHEKDASETTIVAVLAHVVGPVKRPAAAIARDPQLPHGATVITRMFRNFDDGLNLPVVVWKIDVIVPCGRAIVRTVLPIVVPQMEAIDCLPHGDIFAAGTDGEAGADAVDYKMNGKYRKNMAMGTMEGGRKSFRLQTYLKLMEKIGVK